MQSGEAFIAGERRGLGWDGWSFNVWGLAPPKYTPVHHW